MEKKNGEKNMEIEEDTQKEDQKNEKANLSHKKEEVNSINTSKSNFGQQTSNFESNNYSIELNSSLATNDSNNSKSNETINSIKTSFENFFNNKPKFPPIFKINISKNSYDYAYNSEYFDEIYTNLLLDEKNSNLKIDKDYMKKQNEINAQMRAILVDWIIEVHDIFRFKRKTLFQTIFIIDLFLSKKIIQKYRFQLLGVASLLIACKENEVFYPQVKEFLHITDNAYTKTELLNMELYILQILNFEIFNSTSEEFFGILSKALNFNIEQHFLGEYFLYSTLIDYSLLKEEFYDILSKAFGFQRKQHFLGEYFLVSSLIDYKILKYKASVVAASCAYIVMKYFKIDGYKDLYSTRIVLDDFPQKAIKDCARDLCFLVKSLSNSTFRAAINKYSSPYFYNVSELCNDIPK